MSILTVRYFSRTTGITDSTIRTERSTSPLENSGVRNCSEDRHPDFSFALTAENLHLSKLRLVRLGNARDTEAFTLSMSHIELLEYILQAVANLTAPLLRIGPGR